MGELTWANWKAMAPGPYCEFATMFFAFMITFCVVLTGSPAGSPSVMTITWNRADPGEPFDYSCGPQQEIYLKKLNMRGSDRCTTCRLVLHCRIASMDTCWARRCCARPGPSPVAKSAPPTWALCRIATGLHWLHIIWNSTVWGDPVQ